MTPTAYYRFDKLATKSVYRLDCVAATNNYKPFEAMRAAKKRGDTNRGDLFVYLLDVPKQFAIHNGATKSLTTSKGKNLSSIITPDHASRYAFGDVRGTNDAILFAVEQPAIEVYIFQNKAHQKRKIWEMACRGQLDEQLEAMRAVARPQARAMVQGVLPLY